MISDLDTINRAAKVKKAVDGRNDYVWSAMQYGCSSCRAIEWIYLGVGVEGPPALRATGEYIASPFGGPPCKRCGGETMHVNWKRDRQFPPVDPPPGVRYFRVPPVWTEEKLRLFGSVCFAGDTIQT